MMPERYPAAQWIGAHPTNYRLSNRKGFSLIVCHITSGRGKARATADMWRKEGRKSSAHFVIDQDGSIIQSVGLRDVAWHAHLANGKSVGIEHCAREPKELGKDDPGLPLSLCQYQSSTRLAAWLCRVAGLTPSREIILGHTEADPATTHKKCPAGVAGGWDWDKYMKMVLSEYEALGYVG